MNARCTLHASKLEDFKVWLDSYGYAHRPGKGPSQVLQVETPHAGWQCIHSRQGTPDHFVVQQKLEPLVRDFLAGVSKETLRGLLASHRPECLTQKALLSALREARRAIGMHNAPNDCYATGPLTGNEFRDLVECPACSFIALHDEIEAAAAKVPA
jgi:hypothetical protein